MNFSIDLPFFAYCTANFERRPISAVPKYVVAPILIGIRNKQRAASMTQPPAQKSQCKLLKVGSVFYCKINYLCTRPLPSPPASFSTSLTDTRL